MVPLCGEYWGVDVSPGLIDIARKRLGHHERANFSVCPIDALSLTRLAPPCEPFSRIACLGVFIYINDTQVERAMQAIVDCAAPHCRFVLREPVGVQERLTIKEHFSEDMDQTYNAIYRTEAELMTMMARTFFAGGFTVVDSGDVYVDAGLNNRAETRQRYFLLER